MAHRAGSHVHVNSFALGVIAEVRSGVAVIAFNALDPKLTWRGVASMWQCTHLCLLAA
jgi:hypothetical protein